MNKKYVKPEMSLTRVSALENLSAVLNSFDEFSAFTESISTYAFTSAFEEVTTV